jgi:alternate signal-mediated exported protein
MKKSTKGAVAVGAAAVLLMGGAGTLAFWTADDTIDGGDIESGSLTLTVDDCSDTWLDQSDDAPIALLVPGDEVYKDCTVTLDGTGDNLRASVAIDQASVADVEIGDQDDQTKDPLTVSAEITDPAGIDTTAVDVDGPTTVTVRLSVDWPYGPENNDSQLSTTTLDAITLTATQADPNP